MTCDRLSFGQRSGAETIAGTIASRIEVARGLLHTAFAERGRICALGSGDFFEGERLIGRDLSNVTLVDTDQIRLDGIRQKHRLQIVTECAEPATFLRRSGRRREYFDLIYALFLPETLSDGELVDLLRGAAASLRRSGLALVANTNAGAIEMESPSGNSSARRFARSPDELAGAAEKAGLTAEVWLDSTGSTAFALIRPPPGRETSTRL